MFHFKSSYATIFCICVFFLLIQCGNKGEAPKLDLVGENDGRGKEHLLKSDSVATSQRGFHHSAFVIDLTQDLVFRLQRDGWTLTTPRAQVNLEKIRAGGVDLIFSALPMPPGKQPYDALNEGLLAMNSLVAGSNGQVEIVSSFKEAKAAHKRGIVPMLGLLEGADALSDQRVSLPELKRRGLAMIGLVASRNNAFADSARAPRKNGGLTKDGIALLEACNDAGLVIDLTHASPNTFWDVLTRQVGAVVVSHTAVRALRDHPRNLDDLQILALSRYGGVMGLIFNPVFLKSDSNVKATLDDVVAHVMHVYGIGAINGLALGTDYDGIQPPVGLEDVSKLPKLTDALARQGLSDTEISQILGGNAARVFEEVERSHGRVTLTEDELLRPIEIDCDGVIGESKGSPPLGCNGYLLDRGALLPPTSRQKIRIRDIQRRPVRLELFGDPGTPWQVEGQNLEGKVLFNRIVKLDEHGKGALPLPSGRNLIRLFCSPTRLSALGEVVIWGR